MCRSGCGVAIVSICAIKGAGVRRRVPKNVLLLVRLEFHGPFVVAAVALSGI